MKRILMMNELEYIAVPVDLGLFERTKLGSNFAGGTVIDGVLDDAKDQCVLIIRVEDTYLDDGIPPWMKSEEDLENAA